MPSGEATATAASTCSFRPATRTWKKSSRFELKIARKRTRSRRGSFVSSAIARTRSSKSSLDSSRLRKRGTSGPGTGPDSSSSRTPTATPARLPVRDLGWPLGAGPISRPEFIELQGPQGVSRQRIVARRMRWLRAG